MKGKLLNWQILGWEQFQQLTIDFAQIKFPGLSFEEYLKKGNAQHGIDLVSTVLDKDGKNIRIQCKHEDLTPRKLELLVAAFKEGRFFKTTSRFILSTSADLQKEKKQDKLEDIKRSLKEDGIDFEYWDANFFETQLKRHYDLVSYYFSQSIARDFCLPLFKTSSEKLKSLGDDYIPQQLTKIDDQDGAGRFHHLSAETFNLTEYILREKGNKPKICVVGDPYQGKSSLLKQTAYELFRSKELLPVLLELKSYNLQTIEQLLDQETGDWLSHPLNELIIFIDGLDEVPTNQFNEAIQHIRSFINKFPVVPVVFSCRRIFFAHYDVAQKLKEFSCFELTEPRYSDIEGYLVKSLKENRHRFLAEVQQADLLSQLYEPFYLKELVLAFKTPPFKIPASKAVLIETFIRRSVEESFRRKLSNGEDLKHNISTYSRSINKLAFALQKLGLNALPFEKMQELFSEAELEVLKHGALVTITKDKWSFISAVFQEYLAATVLMGLDEHTVLQATTVGTEIVKIREKWLQTFSTLIALLPPEDRRRDKYIAVMENDNIELFFDTDRSKYSEKFRLRIIGMLIASTVKKELLPQLVHDSKIGVFIGNDEPTIDLLIKAISDPQQPDTVKRLCFRVATFTRPNEDQIKKLKNACLLTLDITDDVNLGKACVEVLDKYECYNTEIATILVGKTTLNKAHRYRKEVYRYLINAGEVDNYYQYGLSGFAVLKEYNASVMHHGSERPLLDFLLHAKKYTNIKCLLTSYTANDWDDFRESEVEGFSDSIIELCIEAYKQYPAVIFDVINYTRSIARRDYREIRKAAYFFRCTGTSRIAVESFIEEILSTKGYQFSSLIEKEQVDYVLSRFEEGNFGSGILWGCIYGLREAARNEVADLMMPTFNKYAAADESNSTVLRDWAALEARKAENDLLYISSKTAFKENLIKVFEKFGTGGANADDRFIRTAALDIKVDLASDVMLRFMIRCRKSEKTTSLLACLNAMENVVWFAHFRITEAISLYRRHKSVEYLNVIKEYYDKEITTADFTNTFFLREGKPRFKIKEVLLRDIFREFLFATPPDYLMPMIWSDQSGARVLRKQDYGQEEKSLPALIISSIGTDEIYGFSLLVLRNMRLGIENNSVFATHCALCSYFRIEEATGIIFQRIKERKIDLFSLNDLGAIYIGLGGEAEKLLPVLEEVMDHEYAFIALADVLIPHCAEEIIPMLKECLVTGKEEQKVSAAVRLSYLGDLDGFIFLIEQIKVTKTSPITIQGNFPFARLDTGNALELMRDVAHFLAEPEIGPFNESARSILVEWVNCFASKSEKDLKLVISFLEESYERYKGYKNYFNLLWYRDRCIENFRSYSAISDDIDEVNRIFSLVEK
ncbi:hypothetical protein VRU48_19180 [Pedobacter sp. KR3-3]|uniref:NACHT domain-containing protein n=1 Tax=Pedobacter albus TaxID=3113905 RepID=A0ABU7ICN6_9SPHI|nr:hypothetical protein [Pedobacter sp. KR3-3]MEE1947258.1 hypothetical protein [Pedobacter sp. KR3-3]